jgi:hypothetical protein
MRGQLEQDPLMGRSVKCTRKVKEDCQDYLLSAQGQLDAVFKENEGIHGTTLGAKTILMWKKGIIPLKEPREACHHQPLHELTNTRKKRDRPVGRYCGGIFTRFRNWDN